MTDRPSGTSGRRRSMSAPESLRPMSPEERERQLRLLRKALKQRSYILKISDVLGYGVGFREKKGEWTDEPALIVYVRPGRKAKEYKDLPPHQRIPSRIRLQIGKKTVWL